jgi:hypothetical protein
MRQFQDPHCQEELPGHTLEIFTGSVEIDMLAVFMRLDRNPFKIPIAQKHEPRLKLRMINCEIVY